jgi:peptidoglycan hydrolase-like protein with peptidoglycan-binding domain
MKTLKIGSQGSAVIMLQTLLQKKAYAVIADGDFGEKTENVVIAFQKDNFLDNDGIIGKMTWDLLLETDTKKNKKINDTKYILPIKNYYQTPQIKKAIVLHHTNGWTVVKGTKDRPSMNHFNWWKSTDIHVSTPYSIDYKGNIYEHFDPKFWAYHLGIGGAKKYLDKQSIGIEITNEGYMTKSGDKFHWYSGPTALQYNRPNDEPFYIKDGWRDYNWYAPYSKEQYESTLWLVNFLCDEYNIKKNVIPDNEYHPEILDGNFEGIYNHSNVRDYPAAKPKWDLSPAFPLKKLLKELV